jgi:NitT/TauT family transport system ATP-binding protein
VPVEIKNLNKSYNGLRVIADFSFTFEEGRVYCLFGPSGCGKTTLLHVLAGILPYNSGHITGLENKKISVVFQEDRLLPWLSAGENIKFVLDGAPDTEKYLKAVGLAEFKEYYPEQLSGGMNRRVAIARALAYRGEVLLMDEPFKGIDEKLKKQIMDTILNEKTGDQIIIFTTHNREEARCLADEILEFNTVISRVAVAATEQSVGAQNLARVGEKLSTATLTTGENVR